MRDAPYIEVPLHRRDGSIAAYTKVSSEDAEIANRYRWSLGNHGYAMVTHYLDQGTMLLHRAIMGLKKGDKRQVDHINRDRLDNRRENLRIVSHAQQVQNRCGIDGASKYRGVTFHKRATSAGKWQARCAGRHLGMFDTEEEANAAACAARRIHMPYSTD